MPKATSALQSTSSDVSQSIMTTRLSSWALPEMLLLIRADLAK